MLFNFEPYLLWQVGFSFSEQPDTMTQIKISVNNSPNIMVSTKSDKLLFVFVLPSITIVCSMFGNDLKINS